MTAKRLPWAAVEKLADELRAMLDDPDAGLSDNERRRWEGALVALEVVPGVRTDPLL